VGAKLAAVAALALVILGSGVGGNGHGSSPSVPSRAAPEDGPSVLGSVTPSTISADPIHTNPQIGEAPLNVTFSLTNISSNMPSAGGRLYNFSWNYGDGSLIRVYPGYSSSLNGSIAGPLAFWHVYNTSGSFTVNVRITDNKKEGVTTLTTGVKVGSSNFTVAIDATPDNETTLGRPITFNLTPENGPAPYHVSWTQTPTGCTSLNLTMVCYPPTTGAFTGRFQVVDGLSEVANGNISFVVNPRLVAVVTAVSTYSCSGPQPVLSFTFNATSTGGTLPLEYAWTFDDGSIPFGTASQVRDVPFPGTYTASVVITDGAGATANATHTVTTVAPPCQSQGAPSYAAPLVLYEALVGVVAAVVAVLAFVLWRSLRRSPPRRPVTPAEVPPSAGDAAPVADAPGR